MQALVAANIPELSQSRLLEMLVNPVSDASGANIHKQGRASIAKVSRPTCVFSIPNNK